jgi:hypothetical protein
MELKKTIIFINLLQLINFYLIPVISGNFISNLIIIEVTHFITTHIKFIYLEEH